MKIIYTFFTKRAGVYRLLLLGLAFLLVASCRTTVSINYPELIADLREDSLLVIKAVDIYPGEGTKLLKNYDVYIKGERIEHIRPASGQTDEGYEIIWGKGKTLLPGLIDTHVHLMSGGSAPWAKVSPSPVQNLHAWLFAGITTVYDLGGVAEVTKPIKKNVKEDVVYGPDIFLTGAPTTVKNSHPIPALKELNPWPASAFISRNIYTVSDTSEAEELIAEVANLEVDYIKLVCDEIPPGTPHMTFEVMKALVEAAHKRDLKVFVHIGSAENAIHAARAGADVLAHAVYRDKLTEEHVQILKEEEVKMIFTISGFENINDMYMKKYKPSPMDTLISPEPLLKPVTGDNASKMRKASVMFGLGHAIHHYVDIYQHNFDLLQAYDIPFLVGTDSPNYGAYPGSSLHEEMQSLVNYGYSKAEVLQAATSDAAHMFLEDPDFGTIKEGKLANLLLLDANPLENIDNTQKINLVIKRGQVVERTFEK